jgi:8-oxo-dGTP diphosphatase
MMKNIIVVAAVIINDSQILCVQRGHSKYEYISKKYEFPGGKVEVAETEIEALKREVQEELSLNIKVGEKLITVDHDYPDFSISLHTYLCECSSREIILHEHTDFKWLDVIDLKKLDWAEADIPIIDKLMGSDHTIKRH